MDTTNPSIVARAIRSSLQDMARAYSDWTEFAPAYFALHRSVSYFVASSGVPVPDSFWDEAGFPGNKTAVEIYAALRQKEE